MTIDVSEAAVATKEANLLAYWVHDVASGIYYPPIARESAEMLRELRRQLSECERQRDALALAWNAVMRIPTMTDAQLDQLRQNCTAAISAKETT